jgi:hypothetical protein
LGKGKILTVLALDAEHHRLHPGAPTLQHITCAAVAVAETWTGERIADLLRGVIAQIGCRRFIKDFPVNAQPLIECQKILKTRGLSQKSYEECRSLVATIPRPVIRIRFLAWLDDHLAIANTLGLDGVGLPISSDSIESLFGVAKHHGTGEIKDANRIAMRIPALCGVLTRQDAENVLRISVKEQQHLVGSLPSLTRQRREVLAEGGCLERIQKHAAQPNVRLIAGSKSTQKSDHLIDNTVLSVNGGDP